MKPSRLIRQLTLLIVTLLFVLSYFESPSFAEEKRNGKKSSHSEEGAPKAKKPTRVTAGLFFGHIYHVAEEERAFVVRPVDRNLPRKRFYADMRTDFRWKKRKVSFKSLHLGDKVAVRFVQRDGLYLADAVFLVEGEFVKQDYLPKKLARPKKEGAEGEKKEGEGGEKKEEKKEGKKEEKKSGGGH